MSNPTTKPVVEAYLNFDGRCEEAVEFYQKALDAKVVMLMRVKDAPPNEGEGCSGAEKIDDNKVMHSAITVGETMIMASDCYAKGNPKFEGFSLSIGVKTEAEADKYFNALAAEGKVQMPLEKTFWSPRFGVVVDKFGVSWMVNVVVDMPQQ